MKHREDVRKGPDKTNSSRVGKVSIMIPNTGHVWSEVEPPKQLRGHCHAGSCPVQALLLVAVDSGTISDRHDGLGGGHLSMDKVQELLWISGESNRGRWPSINPVC